MKVIKIEYFNNLEDEETSTFELFDSIEKAYNFTRLEGIKIINAELVEVNKENLYYEENGDLNYEDNSELFNQEKIDLEYLSKTNEETEQTENRLKALGFDI